MYTHPNIVTVPHPSLRQKTKPVSVFDKKIQQVVKKLTDTLESGSDRGVGLSAPQIDTQWRIYVTKTEYAGNFSQEIEPISIGSSNKNSSQIAIFINPRIINTSKEHGLGGDSKSTPLEGCLSIPGLYGPIPRHFWIDLEFETPISLKKEDLALETHTIRLFDFDSRLAQHEIDHLDGILFTDHTIEHDLPLYIENKNGELEMIQNKQFLESY